jgi:hypothetical protein
LTQPKRPGFQEWLARQNTPDWKKLPLTHIAKAIIAEDIIRAGIVKPANCEVFKKPISYFFYGKPAYRVGGDGSIKTESACPICFIFKPETIQFAKNVYPFDTGAFAKRLYKAHVLDEMNVEDFQINPKEFQPDLVISALFNNPIDYLKGNSHALKSAEEITASYDFHAKALIGLAASKGRNEPDDRIFCVEIHLEEDLKLAGNLQAIIVPHTLWSTVTPTPWIKTLSLNHVEIETYNFVPNKHPEYYHGQIEAAVLLLYEKWTLT